MRLDGRRTSSNISDRRGGSGGKIAEKAQGYAVPETFNHGRSDQRVRWLKKGISTGDIRDGDTFSPAYSSL
ncbi:MAG: neutral zinc metallopeptidase [Muribaculaceae bacterium]|nr:neutral zinc metallopeptidase [Muribaculaceae bacterium]